MNKDELRKQYKQKRLHLFQNGEIEIISRKICSILREQEIYKNAKRVMFFYPKGPEINLLGLLEDNKEFFLPRVKLKELEVCPYKIGDNLQLSNFGVMEPVCKPIYDLSLLDIILTPALAVDKKGFRLGYGGGFYDRFFKDKDLRAKKIVVIPSDFITEKMPHDLFDVPCDIILCESSMLPL